MANIVSIRTWFKFKRYKKKKQSLYNLKQKKILSFLAILNSKRYELEFSSFYLNEEQKIHILSKERQDDTAVNGKTKKNVLSSLPPPLLVPITQVVITFRRAVRALRRTSCFSLQF